jgi:adenylate kinase
LAQQGPEKVCRDNFSPQKTAWLSAGELLRKTNDPEVGAILKDGSLVAPETINKIIGQEVSKIDIRQRIVLDGFPRDIKQAEWLVGNEVILNRTVGLAIVLVVPEQELLNRLLNRNRADDNIESIRRRLNIYNQKTDEILNYLGNHDVNVIKIDGTGTIEQVHERIMVELEKCKLD